MSSFIWANSMVSLKSSNNKSLVFNPISKASFLKNKDSAWNLHDRSCRNLKSLLSRSRDQQMMFVIRSNVNPPPEAPNPFGSPSGSLRNWIVGIVLTFVLPFFTHKWGSFLLLKNKIETKIETTEHVVKAIENVAERVDKVIDSITDDLPEDSKLKKALEFVDEIAEGVAKTAHVADDIIIKVEEAEGKLDSLIHHENGKGEETAENKEEGQEITAQDQENDK